MILKLAEKLGLIELKLFILCSTTAGVCHSWQAESETNSRDKLWSHNLQVWASKNALIYKMHAYHSTAGETYPEGLKIKQNQHPEETNLLSPAPRFICMSLHLSASFLPPLPAKVLFLVPPSKQGSQLYMEREKQIDSLEKIAYRVWDDHVGLGEKK